MQPTYFHLGQVQTEGRLLVAQLGVAGPRGDARPCGQWGSSLVVRHQVAWVISRVCKEAMSLLPLIDLKPLGLDNYP